MADINKRKATKMKKALRETQTLAVVRCGHRLPARSLSQTDRQDRLQYRRCPHLTTFLVYICSSVSLLPYISVNKGFEYTAPQLASAV